MRRIFGLIGLVVSGVVFVTLFLQSFDQYSLAWNAYSGNFFDQLIAVITVLWNTVYQPLLLLVVSLVALEGK